MDHLVGELRTRLYGVVLVICWSMVLFCSLETRAQSNTAASQVSIRVLASVSPATADFSKAHLSAFVDDRPAEVQELVSASDQPLVFAILLDISGSVNDKRKQVLEKESSLDLFRRLAGAPNQGFFGDFNDELYLSDKPASVNSVLQELKNVGQFRGGTALHDAVLEAAKLVSRVTKGTSKRRGVFVFTDGQDNASKLSLKQVVPELQREGVPVFCIVLPGLKGPQNVPTVQLSNSTGGTALLLSETSEVVSALVGDVQDQYWLTVEARSVGERKLHSFALRSTETKLRIAVPSRVPQR